jgi:hypothetical protein
MNPILFSFLEYQGKELYFKNIKPGMNGNQILEIISCGLEMIFGKIDLSCVDFTKIGIDLQKCNSTEEVKVTLCSLFNTLVNEIAIIQTKITDIQSSISTIQNTVDTFTDELVKVNSLDSVAGYLSTKVTSDQPNTITTSPDNSKLVLHGFIPIGGLLLYKCTDFSNFDNTGKGKFGTDLWGFAMCNGNNNTYNINDMFVMGSTVLAQLGQTAGSNEVEINKSHLPTDSYSASISGNTSSGGGHTHTYNYPVAKWGSANNGENKNFNAKAPLGTGNTSNDGAHTHTFSGSASIILNPGPKQKLGILPKHIKLLYIQRIF